MKKISYEEAKKRFEDQGRNDIELVESEYVSWKQNSLFFDKIYGDYFKAIPKNVYIQKSCHPKRAIENRKETNINKYGSACSLHGKEIKTKVKQTMLQKYGAEHAWKAKSIKEKVDKTIKEKYGVKNVSQSESIKEKKKQTMMQNHGVEYPIQNKEIQEKAKTTCIEKYGVAHPTQASEVVNKVKQTLQQKYGVSSPFQLPGVQEKSKLGIQENAKKIIETGQPVTEWWKNLPINNKPPYQYISSRLLGKTKVSIGELQTLLSDYVNHKTSLERLGEQLFEETHYNQKVFGLNYKPDFKISDKLYVNVDGLYWHSKANKTKNYHLNLRKSFEEQNMQILQFHEDEVKTKSLIVKSIVDIKSGKIKQKIYARKTVIKPVSQTDANLFLKVNHLMGSIAAKHIGLYLEDQLVSILSYKKFNNNNSCHIERFCSLCNFVVVGAFTKLLSALEKLLGAKEYMYWVDLRYGTGNHLLNHGFVWKKDTLGWKWTDGKNTFNRLKCRANMDSRKLSEKEHAEELGWERIYDAGQRLYVLNKN